MTLEFVERLNRGDVEAYKEWVRNLLAERDQLVESLRSMTTAAATVSDTMTKALERLQQMDVVVKAAQEWRKARASRFGVDDVLAVNRELDRVVDAYTEIERKRS